MSTLKRSFLPAISLLLLWMLPLLGGCTAAPTPVPPTPTPAQCAFVWATQDLPEASEALQAALDEAGLENVVTGHAGVFGENCVNEDGSIQSFAARDVDIYISISVNTLLDTTRMGEVSMQAFEVLMALPPETFPNTINYVNFQFSDGGNTLYLQQSYAGLLIIMSQQPTGQEFYKALQQPAPL